MKKILILLVCCLLLIPGLPGQSEMKDEPAPLIRVCLKRLALTDRADLILDGSYTLESSGYSLYFKEGPAIWPSRCPEACCFPCSPCPWKNTCAAFSPMR